MKPDIEEYLKKVGLSAFEISIYLALLKRGSGTVMELAKASGINRITAHFAVERLVKKGLASETRQGARRVIAVESPEQIGNLVKEKISELNEIKQDYSAVLKSIRRVMAIRPEKQKTQIKYYYGKTAVSKIYEQALNVKEFRAYFNCAQLVKFYPQNIEKFLKIHRGRKEMRIWEIMEDSKEAREYIKKMPKERYYYQLFPSTLSLSVVDYMIFDGRISIVDLKEETSGIIIANKDVYENAKAIFHFVWQMLDQLNKGRPNTSVAP
jgi:sugar-specific transcriptional regulator TrmB